MYFTKKPHHSSELSPLLQGVSTPSEFLSSTTINFAVGIKSLTKWSFSLPWVSNSLLLTFKTIHGLKSKFITLKELLFCDLFETNVKQSCSSEIAAQYRPTPVHTFVTPPCSLHWVIECFSSYHKH